MPFPSGTYLSEIVGRVRDELEALYAQFEGWLRVDHEEDGTHGNIRAKSLTLTANTTTGATGNLVADGSGTFDGNVTADADGSPVSIGAQLLGTGLSANANVSNIWDLIAAPGVINGSLLVQDRAQTGAANPSYFGFMRVSSIGTFPAEYALVPVNHTNLSLFLGTAARRCREVHLRGGVFERDRSVAMGEWTAVAFNAGNFTGNGTITWTVAASDVTTFAYTLIGKTMIVLFSIQTSTVAGAGTRLQILIPNSMTAAKASTIVLLTNDNGTLAIGFASVSAGGTQISIAPNLTGANWTASVDNTGVFGQIAFEVQ
jgi:hypothetical protein